MQGVTKLMLVLPVLIGFYFVVGGE